MKKLAAALAILFFASQSAQAWHHVVAPVTTSKIATSGGITGGGSKTLICPTPAGIFICAIFLYGLIHELKGPKCASNSKYNVANGYNYPALWRPLCADPKRRYAVSVRG